MKFAFVASGVFLVLTPHAEAQLFQRIFGGRQQQVRVQQNACYQQPVYQQQYYAPQVQYQAVAAVPLATIPVAVDLQSYIYAVNASAFQSFRDYQAQKVTPTEATPSATAVAAQQAPVGGVGSNSDAPTGAVVLQKNCMQCHQAGNKPKAEFAIFDEKGKLYPNLPYTEMLERITATEPSQRMPPSKTLAPHDAMAVLRLVSSGIGTATERIAASEPTKPRNPFE